MPLRRIHERLCMVSQEIFSALRSAGILESLSMKNSLALRRTDASRTTFRVGEESVRHSWTKEFSRDWNLRTVIPKADLDSILADKQGDRFDLKESGAELRTFICTAAFTDIRLREVNRITTSLTNFPAAKHVNSPCSPHKSLAINLRRVEMPASSPDERLPVNPHVGSLRGNQHDLVSASMQFQQRAMQQVTEQKSGASWRKATHADNSWE